MTSLVAWVGVDQRGPASVYIATDSRISWVSISKRVDKWDIGRKVFGSQKSPEILGYVGDVLFPSMTLSQVIALIDHGATLHDRISPDERFDQIQNWIKTAFDGFPVNCKNNFKIAYALRVGEGMSSTFHFYSLSWIGNCWTTKSEILPNSSSPIIIWGTGSSSIKRWKDRWNSSSQGSTSRAIFSSLCDSISSGSDTWSGGPPQLVGLYRVGNSRTFGVIHEGQPHILGLQSDPSDFEDDSVEWRNHVFERCSADGIRLTGAQPHHIPKGLGSNKL